MSSNRFHLDNTVCLAFVEVPPLFSQVETRANNSNVNVKKIYVPQRSKQTSLASQSNASSVSVVRPYSAAAAVNNQQREQMKTAFQQHQSEGVFLPFVEDQYQQEMQHHQMFLQGCGRGGAAAHHNSQHVSSSRSSSAAVVVPPFATNLPVPFEEIRHAYQQPYSARPASSTRASSVSGMMMMTTATALPRPEGIRIVNQQNNFSSQQQQRRSASVGGVAQHFQQQQQQQEQPQQKRPMSASATASENGNWKNHQSSIRLAGPDNTQPVANNRIFGIPRMGSARNNNNNNNNIAASLNSTTSNTTFDEKLGPSAGPTYNEMPTNNPTELRKLLSQQSDALRRSQRFAATPRGYPGDHLSGSGVNLKHDNNNNNNNNHNVNGNGGDQTSIPPAPTVNSENLFGHRHRPKNIPNDAFIESAPPSFEDEFKNAWHFGKKKIVAAVHVDAHRSQHVNLLQPWAADADTTDNVGKSVSKQCKKPLAVLQNGIRSTAQQFYDKSFEMTGKVKREDLVEYGEGKSKEQMKTRMLRGTTAFW